MVSMLLTEAGARITQEAGGFVLLESSGAAEQTGGGGIVRHPSPNPYSKPNHPRPYPLVHYPPPRWSETDDRPLAESYRDPVTGWLRPTVALMIGLSGTVTISAHWNRQRQEDDALVIFNDLWGEDA